MTQSAVGEITFLFTDIAGSTRLWQRHPTAMPAALARHDALLRDAIQAHGGHVFKSTGDGVCAAFDSPTAAVAAALDIQRALAAEPWGAVGALRARLALHTGPAEYRDGDYYGLSLSRAARLVATGHGGQTLLSHTTEALVRGRLPPGAALRDQGHHSLRDLKEPEHVFQLNAPGLPTQFPPLLSQLPRPTNLPAQVTSLVGREAETAELCDRLRQPAVRLVTLTGPGGTGKTRLALEVAATLLDEFEHGAFFVPLAFTRQAAHLAPALAQALDVREAGGQPLLEALKQHLRPRRTLLVLDNFEQLLDGAPLVSELLAAAPGLKVIVTSREALRVYGEHLYPVPPLPVPDRRRPLAPEHLAQNPAVALLVERTNAHGPATPLRAEAANADALAEICVRLDGLPLAIELVAARLAHLALPDLLAQLASRLDVLTDGPRDLPQRQRTMRAAINWSYDLLAPEQQQLFAALGVFSGRFTAEAAQAVTGLAGLEALADKNLLQRSEPNGATAEGPRYWMLQVLREYALEQLAAGGGLLPMQRRHTAYYLALVERAEPELAGPQQVAWFAVLKEEHDNLRAALAWALDQGEYEVAVRLCGVLWRYWAGHSHLSEGLRWLNQVLARSDWLPAHWRAKALQGAGRLAMFQNDYAAADVLLEDALRLFQQLGDRSSVAWCLNALGENRFTQGDYARAAVLFDNSLALQRESGNSGGVMRVLNNLGSLARRQGELDRAEQLLLECLALQQAEGSPEGTAIVLNDLGEVLRAKGEFERAAGYYQQSLRLYQALDYPSGAAAVMHNLAIVQDRQGLHGEAAALFRASLEALWAFEEKQLMAQCLAGLAGALCAAGQPPRRAAHLFGAAQALLQQLGTELEPVDQEAYLEFEARLRERLAPADYAAAIAAGAAEPLDDVVAGVLQTGPLSSQLDVEQGRQN